LFWESFSFYLSTFGTHLYYKKVILTPPHFCYHLCWDLCLAGVLLFMERYNWDTKTALIYYLIPVFSGVLAYFFLNQNIVLSQIISMGIIIAGLFITNRKKTSSLTPFLSIKKVHKIVSLYFLKF
jgi:drug/metabolite transporter (DMT)-like permease